MELKNHKLRNFSKLPAVSVFCDCYESIIYRILCLQICLDFLGQLWNSLKQVLLETVIRDLKNGSLGIRIDGNDDLGILHPAQVLYSTRNSCSNI
mmetsp:Transcript_16743/g.38658  ORF Transcript_16743/g.38658 Transcript_16743/m.38658 type:complete len:95 (-) Transcript_16743:981-1265(-)